MSLFDFLPDEYADEFDLGSAQGRRSFIRASIFPLIDEGISANQAIQMYREVGAGIGNQTFRSLYREAAQLGLERRIGFLTGQPPLYDALHGFGNRGNLGAYSYKGRIIYRDKLSGEPLTSNWIIDTDEQLSLSELSELMAERFRQSNTYFDSYVESVEINRAWIN